MSRSERPLKLSPVFGAGQRDDGDDGRPLGNQRTRTQCQRSMRALWHAQVEGNWPDTLMHALWHATTMHIMGSDDCETRQWSKHNAIGFNTFIGEHKTSRFH